MTPREGINWTAITPPNGPQAVEAARTAVLKLRTQIDEQRTAVETAKRAVVDAEQRDREQMATAIRRGAEPKSETVKIEKLRATAAEAERKAAAIEMAVGQAEAELGAVIEAERRTWLVDVERKTEAERASCRARLDELSAGLGRLAELRGIALWLGGEDLAKAPRTRGLGGAPGSARFTANGEAADASLIVGWLRECVDPPPRVEPPTLRVPEPRTAAPVEAA